MFLKQLEIVGFKSFANKVTIDFHPGVTAVVGPNGSGKSNITDAIRWVLGEQSARTLRGAKMEDIIFAGSDGKRPLNMAEVTLTLDNGDRYLNTDYSEISVTRRVFRSGESEFYLNGQKCRLKDIVDLFMDSGLGREAYSIISQGKIDDILNSKPEEKRKIFEEAAGVLKYKTRKENAEKKTRGCPGKPKPRRRHPLRAGKPNPAAGGPSFGRQGILGEAFGTGSDRSGPSRPRHRHHP